MTKNRKDLAMDIIEASPLAKNIVNQAGCNIYVIPSTHREEAGEYHMDKNEIHLDPTRTNTEMALALVNKARHAARNGVQVDPACDLKTNLKSTRAQFADAVAVECAVAHELKGKHPAAWEAFSKEHPKVADSYQAAMSKTGNDQAKSMSVAFKAWYQEYDNVAACDKRTIDLLTKEMGKKHQDFLGKSVDGEQIGARICNINGKSYLGKGFMSDDIKSCTVDNKTAQKIAEFNSNAKRVAKADDKSIESIYVADNKSIEAQKAKEMGKKEQPKESVFTKLSNFLSGNNGR